MGEDKRQIIQDHLHRHIHSWAVTGKSPDEQEQQQHHRCFSIEEETSTISDGASLFSSSFSSSSSSSFDTTDDASSSFPSSANSSGSSLNDLSDLMSQLPIKRGLSKFYQGKSESFTSLARVASIEDLPKKEKNPYNKRMKMKANSKSYGSSLDNYKFHTLPKPIISKKLSRGSSVSSSLLRQKSFTRSPLVPHQQIN